MINYLAEGTQNGKECSWECQSPNEVECRKHFADNNVEIKKLVTADNHHICQYCHSITNGNNTDLLCDDCKRLLGHTHYSQL